MKNIKTKNKVLYAVLGTQAVSLIGTRMTSVGLGIWLYRQTGRTMDLLLIPLFNELPSLLFGHVMGTLVDKSHRKKIIVLSDLGQALGSLILYFTIAGGWFSNFILYAVVFFQGMFTSIQEPAADSVVAMLTDSKNRIRINSIKELAFPAAGVLAPLFAGILYLNVGIEGVIAVDMTTFVLASILFMQLDIPQPEIKESFSFEAEGFRDQLKGGFEYLKAVPQLLWLVIFMSVSNFLINGPLEMIIPYILERAGNEIVVSGMLAIMSVATTLSATVFSVLNPKRNKAAMMKTALSITGFGLIVFGLSRQTAVLGLALFILMLPLPIMNVLFKSILQENTPQDLHGRVFGIAYQWGYGIAPFSFLFFGLLTDRVVRPGFENMHKAKVIQMLGNTQATAYGIVMASAGFFMLILAYTIGKRMEKLSHFIYTNK